MLGQDVYTDPGTGIVIAGDTDAYTRASETLVQVNALLADLRQLEAAQWAGIRTLQDAGGNAATIDGLITDHAQTLTDIQSAESAQADLKAFVDRYRFEVLGSGLSGLAGLGWITWVFALLGTIASWIAWIVTARQRTDDSRLRLQQAVADAVASGKITATEGQTILNTPAPSDGGLFAGLGPYLLIGGLAYLLFISGSAQSAWAAYRPRRGSAARNGGGAGHGTSRYRMGKKFSENRETNPWRFSGAFSSPRKAAVRRGEIPGSEVQTYRMKGKGTRYVVRKWEKNPPANMIPGTVEEVRYQRTGKHSGPYKHKFTSPVTMKALKSGGVLLAPARGRKKLWVEIPD